MTTKHLHVFAINPMAGVLLTVPRASIFGDQDPEILEWDHWTWSSTQLASTALLIARKAREIQGLDYKTGPAIVTDDDNVELNAMLELLDYEKRMGDSVLHIHSLGVVTDITDARLKALDMYVPDTDVLEAIMNALTVLRLARANETLARDLWPYPANGTP